MNADKTESFVLNEQNCSTVANRIKHLLTDHEYTSIIVNEEFEVKIKTEQLLLTDGEAARFDQFGFYANGIDFSWRDNGDTWILSKGSKVSFDTNTITVVKDKLLWIFIVK